MVVARTVPLSEMNWRGLHINTDTSAYTLVASDSGVIFIQNYASATTYTLPAVGTGAGKVFMFVNANTATSTVITSTTALIVGTTTAGAAKTTLTSVAVGDSAIIVGDGTNWFWINQAIAAWTITT